MASLALVVNKRGVTVTGTDIAESANTLFLKDQGITITIGQPLKLPYNPDRIVYTSAIRTYDPQFQQVIKLNSSVMRRGEFLAELADYFPEVVLVGGSHGKTTVAAMLSHILIDAGVDPTFLVGGGIDNRPVYAGAGNGELLVAEVDESDGTQSKIRGTYAIVTNVDDDHFWSLGGLDKLLDCFRGFAFSSDRLLSFDTAVTRDLFSDHKNVDFFSSSHAYRDLRLLVPGSHNQFNASLAIFAATKLGVDVKEAIRSVGKFPGIKRRLTVAFKNRDYVLIDDYAHHPSAVRESIKAIRNNFPKRRLMIIFQPHRYERVLYYASQFARELSHADVLFVLPPFKAWIDNENVCDSKAIVKEIKGIPVFYVEDPLPKLAIKVSDKVKTGDVVTVMGAGDISTLVPILITLLKRKTSVEEWRKWRNGILRE